MKFNKGDIITNGKIEYTVKDIQKNALGDLVYILYNENISKFKYDDNINPHLPDGSIRWMCEQVDKEFYKLNSIKDEQNITVEEMQAEIEKMIPTSEQILEAIDSKMFKLKNIINENIYRDITPEYNKGYNDAIDDICNHIEDGDLWDYIKTDQLSDFEILKGIDFDNMKEDLQKMKKE